MKTIFSATLGLPPPWQVIDVSFSHPEKRLDITINFCQGDTFPCPNCGEKGTPSEPDGEVWFNQNFFRYPTYLHAQVPRHVECSCGTHPIARPWTRAGSRFTLIAADD